MKGSIDSVTINVETLKRPYISPLFFTSFKDNLRPLHEKFYSLRFGCLITVEVENRLLESSSLGSQIVKMNFMNL